MPPKSKSKIKAPIVPTPRRLSLDLETFSSVDLSRCGVYRYAESPDFRILLVGYSLNGGFVKTVDLASGGIMPEELINAILSPSVEKCPPVPAGAEGRNRHDSSHRDRRNH